MPTLAPSSHQAMSSAMVSHEARKKSVLDDEHVRAARNRGRLHHDVTFDVNIRCSTSLENSSCSVTCKYEHVEVFWAWVY